MAEAGLSDAPMRAVDTPPPSASAVYAFGPIEAVRLAGGPGAKQAELERLGHSKDYSCGFMLLLSGRARLLHYGHDSQLEAGDFVLVNRSAPYSLELTEPGELIVLRVAPRDLKAYLPSSEHFCGRPLRGGDGISEGTAELVRSIFAQLELGLGSEFLSRIARNLLDTLATAFSIALDGEFDGSPIICDRNARVRLYVERNLRDPDLKPSSIAANLRMSPRYLRAIFAASKETVSAYILRRRLEECARELADPKLADHSITDIAFGWGFNSGPHFTRSFRGRFRVSPREYRGLYRDGAAPALPG